MKKLVGFLVVLAAMMFFSANAFALTFDFSLAPTSTLPLQWANSGVTVYVTSSTSDASASSVSYSLGNGLGVNRGTSDFFPAGVNAFGTSGRERLILTFDQIVTINSATFLDFLGFSNSDHFTLLVDGDSLVTDGNPNSPGPNSYTFSQSIADRTGQIFTFSVPGNHAYELKTINITSAGGVIPEPASISLLSLGLLGLARKLRKK